MSADEGVFGEYAEKMDGLLRRGPSKNPEASRVEVTKLNCETREKLAGDSDRSIFGIMADCAENAAYHPECYGTGLTSFSAGWRGSCSCAPSENRQGD